MKDVGVVVGTHAEEGLGCGVVAFLQGVYQYVHKGINHEEAQEEQCRQQIKPGLEIFLFHNDLPQVPETAIRSWVLRSNRKTLLGFREKRTVEEV